MTLNSYFLFTNGLNSRLQIWCACWS